MTRAKRRFVPEVVQSSAMDCGPAALKAFVEGHHVNVSYGRLREACQTDVDGTAIETLEEMSNQLGVRVEQVMLPKDLLLLADARSLPCIAVMRLPNGNTHFAVVWSVFAGLVQVMDPASGRRLMTTRQLLHELHEHRMSVPEADWRDWAGSDEGLTLIRKRLVGLDVPAETLDGFINDATNDPSARSLSALDAATRAVRAMVDAKACATGRDAASLVELLIKDTNAIPQSYWSTEPGEDGEVTIRGAVLLRLDATGAATAEEEAESLSPALRAAKTEPPARPTRELWKLLRKDGLLTPLTLTAAFFASAVAIVIEALLFRSLLEVAPLFGLSEYRIGIVIALAAFMLVALVVDFSAFTGELRLGRRLEMRLRVAFQEKLPRLGDRYFRSRLISDMAERNHSIHLLRTLPKLGGQLLRFGFEIVLTTIAIIWLEPAAAPVALAVFAAALLIPLFGMRVFEERDLRVRSHVGALSRFYLDALLGLVPLRVHGAERAIRSEHESILVQWARARLGLQRAAVATEALQFVFGYGLIVAMLLSYFQRGGEPAAMLLLAYWSLNLPVIGLEIVRLAWRYPEQRNTTLRVTEPLNALEEADQAPPGEETPFNDQAMDLRMENVTVRASGNTILEEVNLSVARGEHVAIVGRSGSGKTTLLGLLLGWSFPDVGRVVVDDDVLSASRLEDMRARIAWIDPAVQIWNRSLIDNLRYGNDTHEATTLAAVIKQSELRSVLEMLPEGLQSVLGEGGGLVSGGEGQRVRMARSLLRTHTTLALLDEPFRGLGRDQRARLLARAREHWHDQTLLCVTHDVKETASFDRVLVVEGGRLVEDGVPSALAADPASRYRALLDSEAALTKLWAEDSWRQFEIHDGAVNELERTL